VGLASGTRLPYEITGALGAAGMGERIARDARLKRKVAIKILAARCQPGSIHRRPWKIIRNLSLAAPSV
jgi:hypothetical protein